MSGYTLTQPELFYSLPAAVTKNTWTTQAVISSPGGSGTPDRCIIPAKYFNSINKAAHITAMGTIECDSAASFTLAAGLDAAAGTIAGTGGGTLFTSSALSMSASTTALPFSLELDIVAQAVGHLATTLQVNGEIDIHAGASGTWSTARNSAMISSNVTGIDNEINLWLELFGTWTVSASTNQTILQLFKVYLEN